MSWQRRIASDATAARARVLALAVRVSPVLCAVSAGWILFFTATTVVQRVATARLISLVPVAVGHGLDSAVGRRVLAALVVLAVCVVAPSTLSRFVGVLNRALATRVDAHVQTEILRWSLEPSTIAHLEDPHLRDVARDARGVGDGTYTAGRAVAAMSEVLLRRAQVVASAVLVAVYFHWAVAIALFAVGTLTRRQTVRGSTKTLEVLTGQTSVLRRADYLHQLATTPAAAKETRVFGLADWITSRFVGSWTSAMNEVWLERRRAGGIGRVLRSPFVLVSLVADLLAVRAAIDGTIDLFAFTVLLQSMGQASSGQVQGTDHELLSGSQAIPALESLRRSVDDGSRAGPSRAPAAPRSAIRFEDVSFRYPGRDDDALDGFSLEIPVGRSLAIVGENGAGKTTIVKLLARLYEPTAGRITCDGVDIREYDPHLWQRQVAAIFQDFARYELTAAENVGFGRPERLADRPAVEAAAERAGASALVRALPKGWDTVLSRELTDGTDLSGGQWQRIALARALFAVDGGAAILALDEPTANLDARAESELFDRFLETTQGATTILVSHRFSSVRRADRICAVSGGRMVELGTHDELIARDGLYARMFSLQASRFRERAGDPAEAGNA